jgi:hypothetical protein
MIRDLMTTGQTLNPVGKKSQETLFLQAEKKSESTQEDAGSRDCDDGKKNAEQMLANEWMESNNESRR